MWWIIYLKHGRTKTCEKLRQKSRIEPSKFNVKSTKQISKESVTSKNHFEINETSEKHKTIDGREEDISKKLPKS